jgi:hypothetical protein
MSRQQESSRLSRQEEQVNAINVIEPYKHEGLWVFDDEKAGLNKEPFVAGADTMIDHVTAETPNAESGFVMLFSSTPFPGHQHQLDWVSTESGGNIYRLHQHGLEGWLCPALLKYFDKAPKRIFVQIRPQ